jgi:hypothetical protein
VRDLIISSLNIVLPILLPVLAVWLANVILKRIPDKRVAHALELIDFSAETVVAEMYQRVVADLKDPSKPGTWNETAAASVKAAAVTALKAHVPEAVALLTSCGRNPANIETILGAAVEKAVVDLKTAMPLSITAQELVPPSTPPAPPSDTPAK